MGTDGGAQTQQTRQTDEREEEGRPPFGCLAGSASSAEPPAPAPPLPAAQGPESRNLRVAPPTRQARSKLRSATAGPLWAGFDGHLTHCKKLPRTHRHGGTTSEAVPPLEGWANGGYRGARHAGVTGPRQGVAQRSVWREPGAPSARRSHSLAGRSAGKT